MNSLMFKDIYFRLEHQVSSAVKASLYEIQLCFGNPKWASTLLLGFPKSPFRPLRRINQTLPGTGDRTFAVAGVRLWKTLAPYMLPICVHSVCASPLRFLNHFWQLFELVSSPAPFKLNNLIVLFYESISTTNLNLFYYLLPHASHILFSYLSSIMSSLLFFIVLYKKVWLDLWTVLVFGTTSLNSLSLVVLLWDQEWFTYVRAWS